MSWNPDRQERTQVIDGSQRKFLDWMRRTVSIVSAKVKVSSTRPTAQMCLKLFVTVVVSDSRKYQSQKLGLLLVSP